MRGRLLTIAVIACATVAAVTAATALGLASEDPAVQQYVSQVEPICKSNTEASHHILGGAQQRVNNGKLELASKQFARAAKAFASSIRQIEAVPKPSGYEPKLEKWFSHLEIIDGYLTKISNALKRGDKLQATYEVVKLRSSANAANNVVYDFNLRYCRVTESRFR